MLLAAEFPGSEQVFLTGLAEAEDAAVWTYAASKGLAVVTKDADFAHMSASLGPPPEVLWLRTGNAPTRVVESLLRSRPAEVRAFLADPSAAVIELP